MSPSALARGLWAFRQNNSMKAALTTMTSCSSSSNGWSLHNGGSASGSSVGDGCRRRCCFSTRAVLSQQQASAPSPLSTRAWPNPWAASQQQRSMSFTMTSPTKLSEVMHVEHLADKTPDEIEAIWLEFHDPAASSQGRGSDSSSSTSEGGDQPAPPPPPPPSAASQRRVADVMAADEWRQLQARARSSPLFVLPLAKPGGFLTLLLNWQGPVALLTSVEEYRRFGPGAPPHMAITHYAELADDKGIVLLRGDVVSDAVISLAEARTLLQLVRAFYTDPAAHRLVYKFNHESDKFDFDELLAQLGHRPQGSSGGGAGGGAGDGGGAGSSTSS